MFAGRRSLQNRTGVVQAGLGYGEKCDVRATGRIADGYKQRVMRHATLEMNGETPTWMCTFELRDFFRRTGTWRKGHLGRGDRSLDPLS